MLLTLLFPNHTLFSILKTRAARTLRERERESKIYVVFLLRTKRGKSGKKYPSVQRTRQMLPFLFREVLLFQKNAKTLRL